MVIRYEGTLTYLEPGFLPGSHEAAVRVVSYWSDQDLKEAICEVRSRAPDLDVDQRCLLAFLEEALERRGQKAV